MARKTKVVTITDDNRDVGKSFLLKEMNASQAERWAARAMLALGRSGVDIPEDISAAGFAGIVAIGIRAIAGIPWDLAEPLMNEMFECISIMPDPTHPKVVRDLIESDIEEISTRVRLRDEVIELHSNFSIGGFLSKMREAAATATADNITNTSTSAAPSAQLSPPAAPH